MPPAPSIGRVRRQVRRVLLSGYVPLNPHFSWDAGEVCSPKRWLAMNVERPVRYGDHLEIRRLEVASLQGVKAMESFEWRNGRNANHLIHLALVSHGIAMCAGRMNGDTRVTKIIDELYCMYFSST